MELILRMKLNSCGMEVESVGKNQFFFIPPYLFFPFPFNS